MTAMGAPYRGNPWRVAGGRQPVMHRGANPTPFERGISASLMAGNEQQNPFARSN